MASPVKIVIDAVDKTKKGLTSPIKSMKDLSTAVGQLKPAFIAAGAAAVGAFALMAKAEIDVIENTAKLSKKLGVTTQDLSTMSHAATISGASMAALQPAFKGLGMKAIDASMGMKSAKDEFAALGISALDQNGKIKGSMDLFLEISDSIAGMENGLEKAGIASKLFGRQGLELVPMLSEGSKGIRALQQEARELGLEMGGDLTANSEEYIDNLTRMKGAVTGMVRQVLSGILPAMVDWTASVVKWNKESGVFQGAATTIVDTMKMIGRATAGVAAIFRLVGGIIGEWISTISEQFKALKNVVDAALSGIGDAILYTSEALKQLMARDFSGAAQSFKDAAASMAGGFEEIGPAFEREMQRIAKNSADAAKRIKSDALDIKNAFLGDVDGGGGGGGGANDGAEKSGAQEIPGIGDPEAQSAAAGGFIKKLQSQFEQLTNTKGQLLELEHSRNQQFIEDNINSYDEYIQTVDQLDTIYQSKKAEIAEEEMARELASNEFLTALNEQANLGKMDWLAEQRQIAEDDHLRNLERIDEVSTSEADAIALKEAALAAHKSRIRKLEEDADKQKQQMQDRQLDTFSASLGNMAGASAAFFGQESAAFKAFAISEAIINTYAGANAALRDVTPYPLNIIAAGSIVAAGLANVASISGVAHAGITDVPSDQTFLLKKNERVLSPDQNSDFTSFMEDGGSGGQSIDLTINIDGQALYDALGKASSNGQFTIDARAIA